MPGLKGKVAVVTGATGGIGSAACKAFARAGCDVLATGRDEAKLTSLKQALAKLGGAARSMPCDLRDPESVEGLADAVREAFGGCDVLVNNAGVGIGGPVLDMPVEHWDETLEVNLRGPFLVTRALGPLLREGATILNIASVSAEGHGGLAAYSASKAGLVAWSKALGQELAPRGIRVVAVSPGYVATPMVEGASVAARDMVQPDDLAEVLVSLATQPASVYIDEVTVWPRRLYAD